MGEQQQPPRSSPARSREGGGSRECQGEFLPSQACGLPGEPSRASTWPGPHRALESHRQEGMSHLGKGEFLQMVHKTEEQGSCFEVYGGYLVFYH